MYYSLARSPLRLPGSADTQSFDVTSYSLLVGGFKHEFYFPFHIWDVILPIDELIFSRWLLHHQPEKLWKITIFDG